jgi:hypothetical protein
MDSEGSSVVANRFGRLCGNLGSLSRFQNWATRGFDEQIIFAAEIVSYLVLEIRLRFRRPAALT